jgi:hypothetical protein
MEESAKINMLSDIKSKVESMDKYHQIEILKIISKNHCRINENKSGVFINLSFLNDATIKELDDYIHYIYEQEESLKTMEYQKREFKESFFDENEDKDNSILILKKDSNDNDGSE